MEGIDIGYNVGIQMVKQKRSIIIAVIDSGVQYNHDAFNNSIWINKGEIPQDGVDNNNGYIDDVYGWNFHSGNNDIGEGYQIMRSIKELSRDRVSMGPGTLYGILSRLEKKELIKLVEEDSRKKVYIITDSGKETLGFEYKRLMEMVKDGEIIEKECL